MKKVNRCERNKKQFPESWIHETIRKDNSCFRRKLPFDVYSFWIKFWSSTVFLSNKYSKHVSHLGNDKTSQCNLDIIKLNLSGSQEFSSRNHQVLSVVLRQCAWNCFGKPLPNVLNIAFTYSYPLEIEIFPDLHVLRSSFLETCVYVCGHDNSKIHSRRNTKFQI